MNWIQKTLKYHKLEYSYGDENNYEDYSITNGDKPPIETLEEIWETLKLQENKQLRITELKKLLSESDWTQVSDVSERKGLDFVSQWKQKRNDWWNELRGLES